MELTSTARVRVHRTRPLGDCSTLLSSTILMLTTEQPHRSARAVRQQRPARLPSIACLDCMLRFKKAIARNNLYDPCVGSPVSSSTAQRKSVDPQSLFKPYRTATCTSYDVIHALCTLLTSSGTCLPSLVLSPWHRASLVAPEPSERGLATAIDMKCR